MNKCEELGCRWVAESKKDKKVKCMLNAGDNICKLFATQEIWELIKGKGRGVGTKGRIKTVDAEARGDVTELQTMRLGIARFNIAQAAAVLDRMPKDSIPAETLTELEQTLAQCLSLEKELYNLQRQANYNIVKRA